MLPWLRRYRLEFGPVVGNPPTETLDRVGRRAVIKRVDLELGYPEGLQALVDSDRAFRDGRQGWAYEMDAPTAFGLPPDTEV
jgi:hypothetical protein